MSFVDSWAKAIEDFGGAIRAKIGLSVDIPKFEDEVPIVKDAVEGGLAVLNYPLTQVKERGSVPFIAARLARRDAVRAGSEPGGIDEWRRFFDGDTWREAREESRRTAGARAIVDMASQSTFGPGVAELAGIEGEVKDRYAITDRELAKIRGESTRYNILTGATDVLLDFTLDPLVLLGKAGSAYRATKLKRPIRPGEDVVRAMEEDPAGFLARRSPGNLHRRTRSILENIRGKDADWIYNGVDGLKDSTNGPALAAALAKAGQKPTTQEAKLVLRLAYGDASAVTELKLLDVELADMLTKARMDVDDLLEANKWEDTGPGRKRYWDKPEIQAKYAERLKNLEDYQTTLQAERDHLIWLQENVLDVAKGRTLRVTEKSRRAAETAHRVIQKSLWSVPVRAYHQSRTQAQRRHIELDSPDSPAELKAMLDQVTDMDPARRGKLMSGYLNAKDVGTKIQAVNRAKAAVFAHEAKRFGYTPKQAQQIFTEYVTRERAFFGPRGGEPTQRYTATVDETTGLPADTFVDEDGILNVVPELFTQLGNRLPTLDVKVVRQALKRSKNRFTAMADWLDEVDKVNLHGGSEAIRALDRARWGVASAATDTANMLNRFWKFSVLARLGYTGRILVDDHLRIWAKLGSSAAALESDLLYSGAKAFGRGITGKNRRDAKALFLADKTRAEELREQIVDAERLIDDHKLADAMFRARIEKANQAPAFQRRPVRMEAPKYDIAADRAYRDSLREELKTVEARMEQAKKNPVKTYMPQLGKRLGEGELEYNGVRLADAFGGEDAGLRRTLASQQGMHDAFLEINEGKHYNRSAIDGNGWKRIEPNEPGHTEAWLDAINKQLRQDPMAIQFIKGASEGDVLKWLRSDPKGRYHARQLPFHAADQERWVANVKQMVDQYIPQAEWRETLAKRELRAEEIKAFIDEGRPVPAVHGPGLGLNLGRGPASRLMNNVMSTTMKYLSEVPSDKASRHPLYVALYRQRVKQEVDTILADPARTKSREVVDGEDLERAYKASHAYALKGLKETLYDISAHSNAAEFMRFVSPFMGAWQETMKRWWGLAKDKPQILAYFNMAWQMPNKMGLVVDIDGNPVEESKELTDDEFLRIQLPAWAGGPTSEDPLRGQFTVAGQQWMIPKSSFNITLQGDPWWLPGAGPVLQIPMGWVAEEFPSENKAVSEVYNFFNPFGPPDDLADAVLPATAKRIRSYFQAEKARDFAGDMTTIYRADLIRWEQSGREGPEPTLAQAREKAKALYMLRAANNLTNPFPALHRSPYQFYRDAYNALSERARLEGRTQQWIDDTFIERYGEDYFTFVQSISQNNLGAPASVGAVQASKRYKDLIGKYPEIGRYIIGIEGEGEFNTFAYSYQLDHTYIPGSSKKMRDFKDPKTAQAAAEAKAGWRKYIKFTHSLDAMAAAQGFTSHRDSPQLMALKRVTVEKLKEQNPSWRADYEERDEGWFERRVEEIGKIVDDKRLRDREDVKVVRQWYALRQSFQAMLQARELEGGSKNPAAKSNRDLMFLYTSAVNRLAESNTQFDGTWFIPLLERDPMLLDLTAMQGVDE